MTRNVRYATTLVVLALATACGSNAPRRPATPPWEVSVREKVARGDYAAAIAELEDQTSRVPPPEFSEEALYWQGYLQAYGRSDFRKARIPLQSLVDSQPRHRLGAATLRLLGDCYYFESLYEPARRQYRALLELHAAEGHGAYALYQTGNCWYQENDPGRALTSWREAVEKYPKDPWSLKAQMQVANVYVALDDPQMARPELLKLLEMTQDASLRSSVEISLRRFDSAPAKGGKR